MVHPVETLDDTVQVESPEKPSRKVVRVRVSVAARLARVFYTFLSSALAAGLLFQVFFAGMGTFGADWSYHVTLVHFLEPLPLLMVPVAFVGRLSWVLRILPLGIVFLIGAQYALAHAAVPAAALHPVNGFLILLTSLFIARRAWAAVLRKG
jgi:mercuric ion transport protein